MTDFVESTALMVSVEEANAFRTELDVYDTATVAALDFNREALERVQEHLDLLLAQAHVLPDGRRVFKTEDGTQVFDEFGNELDASVIDPNDVANSRPTWESYKPHFDEKARLMAEQDELLDYQEKLDEARERLDAGDITSEELDELREELRESAPEAVRRHIPEMAEGPDATTGQPDPDPVQATDLDITADMVSTGAVPGLTR